METLLARQSELISHPLYQRLDSLENLRHFMSYHVFAVWDFMSLLKSLQRQITCVSHPWRPSSYSPEMVRLINQIVLGEESDLDSFGNPTSHFELYLKAMDETGASTSGIHEFLSSMDTNSIPEGAREFVEHNLRVADNGHVVEVAASFFFGREKLIPEMFDSMVKVLDDNKIKAPTFLYYLKRHIEVDSEEHGPLAMKCLNELVGVDEELNQRSISAGILALEMRNRLWNNVLNTIPN